MNKLAEAFRAGVEKEAASTARMLDEILSNTDGYMFHTTSPKNIPDILSDGLKPRNQLDDFADGIGESKNLVPSYTDPADWVYLSPFPSDAVDRFSNIAVNIDRGILKNMRFDPENAWHNPKKIMQSLGGGTNDPAIMFRHQGGIPPDKIEPVSFGKKQVKEYWKSLPNEFG